MEFGKVTRWSPTEFPMTMRAALNRSRPLYNESGEPGIWRTTLAGSTQVRPFAGSNNFSLFLGHRVTTATTGAGP